MRITWIICVVNLLATEREMIRLMFCVNRDLDDCNKQEQSHTSYSDCPFLPSFLPPPLVSRVSRLLGDATDWPPFSLFHWQICFLKGSLPRPNTILIFSQAYSMCLISALQPTRLFFQFGGCVVSFVFILLCKVNTPCSDLFPRKELILSLLRVTAGSTLQRPGAAWGVVVFCAG